MISTEFWLLQSYHRRMPCIVSGLYGLPTAHFDGLFSKGQVQSEAVGEKHSTAGD